MWKVLWWFCEPHKSAFVSGETRSSSRRCSVIDYRGKNLVNDINWVSKPTRNFDIKGNFSNSQKQSLHRVTHNISSKWKCHVVIITESIFRRGDFQKLLDSNCWNVRVQLLQKCYVDGLVVSGLSLSGVLFTWHGWVFFLMMMLWTQLWE